MLAWSTLQRLALGKLRLKPDEFWALTPLEFLTMLGLEQGNGVLNRDRLSTLMHAYPDEEKEENDGGL